MNKKMKVITLLLLYTVIIFPIKIEDFVKTIFEQYPDAVAVELTWQSAYDNYNATLLKADSKLTIMEADLERLQAYKTYMQDRWQVIKEVFNILFELEEISIKKAIADIEYKMYSEDLANKEKAVAYGGVSERDVEIARINTDKSKGKLDYYKSIQSQKEDFITDTLFVSELPKLTLNTEGIQSLSVEEMNTIKEDNIDRKIESHKKQIEETKYKLAQSGMTTSYLANVNKRSAKIHQLKEEGFANAAVYNINLAYEDVKYSSLRYHSALALKDIYLKKLIKLQEAQKEGYITSYDYYQGVLDIYEYDQLAWQEKFKLFENIVDLLQAKGVDPIEVLPKFVKEKE
ncbi:MAG: hypothetical protein ACOC34_02855 [Thermotogota bacterium]